MTEQVKSTFVAPCKYGSTGPELCILHIHVRRFKAEATIRLAISTCRSGLASGSVSTIMYHVMESDKLRRI